MKYIFLTLLAGVLSMMLGGCSVPEQEGSPLLYENQCQEDQVLDINTSMPVADSYTEPVPQPQVITSWEAEIMMSGEAVIILDVRTQGEFEEGHIENAVLLPLDELLERAQAVIPNKKYTILIYCRSGNRSNQAAYLLIEMGYTAVFDFGGIISWHGEIVR